MANNKVLKRRVVVTGLGAITPIGNSVAEFWDGIRKGKVGIGEITKFDTTDYKVKLAAEVKDFVPGDHMDKKAARRMEAFSQYAVAAAREAYEDSGLEIEKEDPNLKGRTIIGTADPSIFDESRGESIAQLMAKHPNYIYWSPGDNTRIAGKMQFHYRLAFDEEGDCMFQVFNTCKHFIRTFPSLVYSESDVEDIDTDLEDHI